MRPDDACDMVNDLEALSITILGLDGWYFRDDEQKKNVWLTQDLSVDLLCKGRSVAGERPCAC